MLKELQIGKQLTIKNPVLLAPMAGITDLVYRNLVKSFGCDLSYSEMISSVALFRNSSATNKMLATNQKDKPFAVQLAGSDLTIMQEAAKKNENLGADLIDINMGCPVKKVIKGIAGSALMQDEILAGKVMESVVKAVNIPVTVKMRLGWDNTSLNAKNLCHIAQESGVKLVTIHGRTRNQFYTGTADLASIKPIKDSLKYLKIIANGDIKTLQDAKNAFDLSGADGIMIGRGTYGKPWIIKQMVEYLTQGKVTYHPTLKDIFHIALSHFNNILDYYGEERGIKIARKHLSHYTKGLHSSAQLREKINFSTNIQEVKDSLFECFENSINISQVNNNKGISNEAYY